MNKHLDDFILSVSVILLLALIGYWLQTYFEPVHWTADWTKEEICMTYNKYCIDGICGDCGVWK